MSGDDELDIYRDIQILALEKFVYPDESAFYRRLCRWFATEFHTDIFKVETKPLEYLLMHFFENKLEKMTKDDLAKYKKFLINKEEVLEEEEEDEAFAEQLEMEFLSRKQAELDAQNRKALEAQNKVQPPEDINIKF